MSDPLDGIRALVGSEQQPIDMAWSDLIALMRPDYADALKYVAAALVEIGDDPKCQPTPRNIGWLLRKSGQKIAEIVARTAIGRSPTAEDLVGTLSGVAVVLVQVNSVFMEDPRNRPPAAPIVPA